MDKRATLFDQAFKGHGCKLKERFEKGGKMFEQKKEG